MNNIFLNNWKLYLSLSRFFFFFHPPNKLISLFFHELSKIFFIYIFQFYEILIRPHFIILLYIIKMESGSLSQIRFKIAKLKIFIMPYLFVCINKSIFFILFDIKAWRPNEIKLNLDFKKKKIFMIFYALSFSFFFIICIVFIHH